MAKTKKILNNTLQWILNHAISIMIVLTAAWASFLFIYQARLNAINTISVSSPIVYPSSDVVIDINNYSSLTGTVVDNPEDAHAAITAVMIENSPAARPQSGLKNSGLVYEAVAEGGITRFLVLYQAEKPQIVGPVRSLRPYYVEWLRPYDASVAHVGGSKRALDEVRNGSYRDIDQFFNGGTYWRSSDRRAPHNVYTSFERIDRLNQEKGYSTSKIKGFSRLKATLSEKEKAHQEALPKANVINAKISSAQYNPSYTYDSTSNIYLRSLGGGPHMDREDGQISPSVVIAMFVNENTVNEDGVRENIITTGEGRAVIFQNGTIQDVLWKREAVTDEIVFLDTAGEVVPLARGQTWIMAIPNGKGDVQWQ